MKLYGEDHEFTKLVINLKGTDPDDAFSSVPYEKVGTLNARIPFISLIELGLPLSLLP